jgi:hypothetical protein
MCLCTAGFEGILVPRMKGWFFRALAPTCVYPVRFAPGLFWSCMGTFVRFEFSFLGFSWTWG